MPLSAALSLTAQLTACRRSAISPEVAARAVTGHHAAHHVVDAHGLLGLDPLAANELDRAMAAALLLVDADWLLVLPRPGRLAPLTGPPELTALALDAGAAVVAATGGMAWVPHPVGSAIQWVVVPAHRPKPVDDPGDADRQLRQLILTVGRTLTDLPLSPGERPEIDPPPPLPMIYGRRAQQTVARAWDLFHAAEVALADDPASLGVPTALGVAPRRQALMDLRDAAEAALTTAVSGPNADRERDRD